MYPAAAAPRTLGTQAIDLQRLMTELTLTGTQADFVYLVHNVVKACLWFMLLLPLHHGETEGL